MKLTWEQFKVLILQFKGERAIRFADFDSFYLLWIDIGNMVFSCEIIKPGDEATDFENNFKQFIVKEFDTTGYKINVPTFTYFGGNSLWTGASNGTILKFTAVAGLENFFDILISEMAYLRGGFYKIKNVNDVHDDDYLEFSIIDKDNILGYGSMFELSKFVKKWQVKEYPEFQFISESAELLMPGLYYRIGYKSYGTVDINFKGALWWVTNIG